VRHCQKLQVLARVLTVGRVFIYELIYLFFFRFFLDSEAVLATFEVLANSNSRKKVLVMEKSDFERLVQENLSVGNGSKTNLTGRLKAVADGEQIDLPLWNIVKGVSWIIMFGSGHDIFENGIILVVEERNFGQELGPGSALISYKEEGGETYSWVEGKLMVSHDAVGNRYYGGGSAKMMSGSPVVNIENMIFDFV